MMKQTNTSNSDDKAAIERPDRIPHIDYEVDCSRIPEVWLVKVPKFVANAWENAGPHSSLGKLVVSGILDEPNNQIKFVSNKSTSSQATASTSNLIKTSAPSSNLPDEYKVTLTPMSEQHMIILSQPQSSSSDNPGSMAVEGEVTKRGEFRPTANTSYMDLKKNVIREAAKPARTTMMLDKAPVNYRPRAAVQMDYEIEQRKKKEIKKTRDDKEVVQQKIFRAFEKQKFYGIKDLERITCQSIPYLKEILRDICNQRRTNPNKNMWELKPEYRTSSDNL